MAIVGFFTGDPSSQTWEDPSHKHPDTDAFGDKDPLDVCEIGEAVGKTGEVKQVKVLGAMALIDEGAFRPLRPSSPRRHQNGNPCGWLPGETDWKIIAIDVKDPLADKLNDIEDVEREKPDYLHQTYVWFRDYKGANGNKFAFDGKAKPKVDPKQ